MSMKGNYSIAREGITFDSVLTLLNRTALNPLLTVPLYLASLYTEKGREEALRRPAVAKWLKRALVLSLIAKVNNTLGSGAQNNWKNDTYDWKKEIVVVTGGSDGIGAHIVKFLAEKGITVVILDIQEPKFRLRSTIHYYKCDLASPSEIRYIAASINQQVGHPTVLINNAGFARGNTILTTTETSLNLSFKINAFCHYFLAQAFLPNMIANNHGMIVTVASLAAYVTSPGLVDYSASKAAALVFHEGLQAELATALNAPAVRTIAVCQGFTRTPLFEGFDNGDPFVNYPLQPETVAETIVKAVLAGRSDHIILPRGNAAISGLRAFPNFIQSYLRKDLKKMMTNWKGRQVVQPSEKEETKAVGEAKEGNTLVEDSTVIV